MARELHFVLLYNGLLLERIIMVKRHIPLKRILRKTLVTMTSLGLFVLSVSHVEAEQYEGFYHGRAVVVHTSPLPVLLHRLVPPDHGRHITLREYQTARRSSSQLVIQNASSIRKSDGNLGSPSK